jgi:hypothetical protein
VFCPKDLGENVKRAMGNRLRTVEAFWDLLHRKIPEDTSVQILKTESERFAKSSWQAHMLDFLKANPGYLSAVQVMDDTCESASSRVEEFFGACKNLTRHEVLPQVTVVKEIRLLGQMAFARRSHGHISPLSPEIMSYADQLKLGSFAAIVLNGESTKLTGAMTKRPTNPFPDCCTVA